MRTAKQTITETFIHLLTEQTFEDLSVKDIVSYAGISRSTFYLHFTDKYELMDAVRSQVNGRLLQIYNEPSAAETINLKICQHVFRYRSFYRQEFSDAGRIHELTRRFADELEHVFGDEDLAVFAGWGTIGYLVSWVKGGFAMAPREASDKLMKILFADWTANLADTRERSN
ncbi:TetR/AcrR family transcriptional regulator [Planococcus maritimus]|uniref:TetR/AcrR family transcriptional regulator n=1 Tax=Planococcus maritimus TaxID=192421 RepID=UPI00232D661A|nr:TetR family transcriptional regulator [Planococcus maritimus]